MGVTTPNKQTRANSTGAAGNTSNLSSALKNAGALGGSVPVGGIGRSLMGMSSLSRGPVANALTGIQLQQLVEAMKIDVEKALNPEWNLRLIPIEKGAAGGRLPISVLVIAVSLVAAPDEWAYFPLLIEASITPLSSRSATVGTEQIQLIYVTADLIDANMIDIIYDEVQVNLGSGKIKQSNIAVVNRTFDHTVPGAVRGLLFAAAESAHLRLVTDNGGYSEIHIPSLEKDGTPTIDITFQPETIIDDLGLPIRSSIAVGLKVVPVNNNNSLTPTPPVELTRLNGYIDLTFVGQPQQNTLMPQRNPTPEDLIAYRARFIITDLKTFDPTLSATLLALATAPSLMQGQQWCRTFLPTPGSYKNKGRSNPHDIGVVGYEVHPDNIPWNTNTDTFQPEQLGNILDMFFTPGIEIAIDIPESSMNNAQLLTLLEAASTDDTEAAAAANLVYGTLKAMTGDVFEQEMTKLNAFGQYPVLTGYDRLLSGLFYEDGERRDLREQDYISTLGAVKLEGIKDLYRWSDTFTNLSADVDARNSTRAQIQNGLLGDTVEYTGAIRRVVLNPVFLVGMVQAFKRCGLVFQNKDAGTGLGGGRVINGRGNDSLMTSAATTGLYGTGYSNAGGGNNNGFTRGRF